MISGLGSPKQLIELLEGPDCEDITDEVLNMEFSTVFFHINSLNFPIDVEILHVADGDSKIFFIDAETSETAIIYPNDDGSFTIPSRGVIAVLNPQQ